LVVILLVKEIHSASIFVVYFNHGQGCKMEALGPGYGERNSMAKPCVYMMGAEGLSTEEMSQHES